MSERGAASIERPPKFQSKALQVLQSQGVLCFDYLKENADDIYESYDLQANSSQQQNLQARAQYMCLFDCLFTETFIPAGSVGLIMNAKNGEWSLNIIYIYTPIHQFSAPSWPRIFVCRSRNAFDQRHIFANGGGASGPWTADQGDLPREQNGGDRRERMLLHLYPTP